MGGWGVSVQSMGEMGKDFCSNFVQPFLENIDRRSCNDGSRELIPVLHNPHRKYRPSPLAVALTLAYLEGGALVGHVEREEKTISSFNNLYPWCEML